ncbi:MAG: hypothetical protein AB3N63_03265 [Puniceicoccaceae bacterium]
MDKMQISQATEDVWRHHCDKLKEALDESLRQLQNLIRLDEHRRHGHEKEALQETLGPLGSNSLDLGALSKVLGSSGENRALSDEHLQRIQGLIDRTTELMAGCPDAPATDSQAGIEEDEEIIHAKAEAHLNRIAEIFRTIRMAQMEVHSKYHPATHDPVFDNFNWRNLSPAELSLCPPFMIIANLDEERGEKLRKIMSLLESRKPIKIAAMRSSLKKDYSPTADPSVPATMAVETLPLAMRGVYFLQSSIATPLFRKQLFTAMCSPRPTLISLLESREGEDENDFKRRADKALRAHAFPAVLYDPDRARGFVSCFDISANPMQEESADVMTFAHFAAGEKEFASEFTEPTADFSPDDLVPLTEFLELARHQRVGKHPCVNLKRRDGQVRPKIVSPAIVTQTSDYLHLWKTLQEIAGEDNPYVKSTEANLAAEFSEQQKALEESLQKELERQLTQREKIAVASAIQRMVAHLTGVPASDIDVSNFLASIKDEE